MINIGILVPAVVVFFMTLGVIVWRLNVRKKYRFVFRVWSKDLSTSRLVKARITIDKENKNMRHFTFGDINPSMLVLRDPVTYSNGVAERWVIVDENGDYQYLSTVNKIYSSKEVVDEKTGKPLLKPIDDVKYMQTRLHPVNKMLALEQMRNNQKRYDKTSTMVAGMVFGSIIFGIILAFGIIYGMGTLVKHSAAVNDNIHTMRDMQVDSDANMIKILDVMKELTVNLGYIYGQINEGVNGSIVRPVTGFTP